MKLLLACLLLIATPSEAARGKQTTLAPGLVAFNVKRGIVLEFKGQRLFESAHLSAKVKENHIVEDAKVEVLLIELKSLDAACPTDYRVIRIPASGSGIKWTEEFGNCGPVSEITWGKDPIFQFKPFTRHGGSKVEGSSFKYDVWEGKIYIQSGESAPHNSGY